LAKFQMISKQRY